ncbi:MAG: hypothetical protein WKF70_03145 [Chitinophagaceae bacterium]
MKRTIVIIVLVLAVIGGWFGYREWNRAHPNLLNKTADEQAHASALIAAFQKDTASASKQYIDKIIWVTGVIKKIDDEENPVVLFLGTISEMSSVQCSMDSANKAAYNELTVGTTVSLKGTCSGYQFDELLGTDVQLSRCVIETKK